MAGRRNQSVSPFRGVLMTFALLALAWRMMIPAGFMAAAPTNDLPFAVVLCTGQGPVSLEAGQSLAKHGDQHQAPASHDSPCAFAGHGGALTAPDLIGTHPVVFAAYAAPLPAAVAHLAPGRGLSAPPPPARGPPSLLI